MGVSISRNPSCSIKFRSSMDTLLFIIIFRWISGLRRSKNRYLRRKSSFVWEFSSMGKGGVSASDRMRISEAITSISPVFRLSFTAAARFSTVPVTATTYSLRREPAFAKPSLPTFGSSKTIWSRPERSRKSMKIKLPKFLRFCTQPMTVTCWPISLPDTSVHLWVLCRPFIDSAMFFLLIINFYLNKTLIPVKEFFYLPISFCRQLFLLEFFIFIHPGYQHLFPCPALLLGFCNDLGKLFFRIIFFN